MPSKSKREAPLEKYPVGLYFSDWFPYKFFLYSSIKIYPIMKEINQVHFTLGDNAGILLMQIAQEALLCELDPEKAVKLSPHLLWDARIILL